MRWLLVFLLAFLVFNGLRAGCARSAWAGCRATSASLRGRDWYVPLAAARGAERAGDVDRAAVLMGQALMCQTWPQPRQRTRTSLPVASDCSSSRRP
jgi:hypothetical protein